MSSSIVTCCSHSSFFFCMTLKDRYSNLEPVSSQRDGEGGRLPSTDSTHACTYAYVNDIPVRVESNGMWVNPSTWYNTGFASDDNTSGEVRDEHPPLLLLDIGLHKSETHSVPPTLRTHTSPAVPQALAALCFTKMHRRTLMRREARAARHLVEVRWMDMLTPTPNSSKVADAERKLKEAKAAVQRFRTFSNPIIRSSRAWTCTRRWRQQQGGSPSVLLIPSCHREHYGAVHLEPRHAYRMVKFIGDQLCLSGSWEPAPIPLRPVSTPFPFAACPAASPSVASAHAPLLSETADAEVKGALGLALYLRENPGKTEQDFQEDDCLLDYQERCWASLFSCSVR